MTVDSKNQHDTFDARRVLHFHQRRLHRWTGFVIACWVITAGYLVVGTGAYLIYVHPKLHVFLKSDDWPSERAQSVTRLLAFWLHAIMWWPVLLLVAAIGTVWLMFAFRRATLSQIQLNLTDISRQLDRLSQQEQK